MATTPFALACGGGAAGVRPATGVSENATPPSASSTTPDPTRATTATATPEPRPRGGVARLAAGRSFAFDTLAPHLSGESSTLEVLGRTHSRLVQWADFTSGEFAPDLAASWEQPDRRTLIVRIDPRARWHPRPGGDAPVSATEVAGWLDAVVRRAKVGSAGTPLIQRSQDWQTVESVAAVAPDLVRVRLARSDPFILQTLAGRFALVQRPGFLERPAKEFASAESVVGSGPFMLDALGPTLRFSAHTGGHRAPLLDRLDVSEPTDVADRFGSGELDEATLHDRREAPALRSAHGATLREFPRYEDAPIVSTLWAANPPWNDARLRRALSAALNRVVLADKLFGGRAEATGPIAPVHLASARAGRAISGFDGYRADAEADAREARSLWEAGGGPGLGKVTVDIPAIFEPAFSASSVIVGRLNDVLGKQFAAAVETYTTISKKAVEGRYGNGTPAFWFGWGPPFAEPDPSRWLVETYGANSGRSGVQSGAVKVAALRLGRAYEAADRFAAAREIEAALLQEADGGILHWVAQRHELVRWAYLERPIQASSWWPQHMDAELALDPSAPGYAGRA